MAKAETSKKRVSSVSTDVLPSVEGSIILPAISAVTADPLGHNAREVSRSRRRSNEVNKKTAETKVVAKEEKAKKNISKKKSGKKAETNLEKIEVVKRTEVSKGGESGVEGRERYFEAVGRRKTAVARVRLFTKSGDFLVNGRPYGVYFPTLDLQKIVEDALQKMKLFGRFKASVKVSGGGTYSQAQAVRHGLARCLVKFNPDFRKRLKRVGFLKRDPRKKERKKPGLKRARKAPQWSKR